MQIEKRWVEVIDNSQGTFDQLYVVETLVRWHADQGELFDRAGYEDPQSRLSEGQALLDLAESRISTAALEAIRSEWLDGWLEYLLGIECDLQVHEDYPDCYGYWGDFLPCGHETYSCRCTGPCFNCGKQTPLRDEDHDFECIRCLSDRVNNRCNGCGEFADHDSDSC